MNNDAAGLLDTPKFDTFYRVFKKALKIKGRANLLAFYLTFETGPEGPEL